jgi:hypothetical protein
LSFTRNSLNSSGSSSSGSSCTHHQQQQGASMGQLGGTGHRSRFTHSCMHPLS